MDVVVPALGESISEAVIAKWLKKVGEATAQDEPIVDLETDKVSVQLPAPAKGTLIELRFAEGATVKVGDVVGFVVAGTTGVPAAAPAPAPADRYVVRRGDSPWTIARRHRVALADLLAWNDLEADAILRPGQVVRIAAP